MRLRFRAASYLVSTVLGAVLSGAVGVAAVLALDYGVEGVLLGIVAGNAAAAVYGAVAVRQDLSRHLSAFELRRMLAFGLPLVPAGLALWGLTFVDRIMLSRLGDLEEVGKYAVASRVSGVINLGVIGFRSLSARTCSPSTRRIEGSRRSCAVRRLRISRSPSRSPPYA